MSASIFHCGRCDEGSPSISTASGATLRCTRCNRVVFGASMAEAFRKFEAPDADAMLGRCGMTTVKCEAQREVALIAPDGKAVPGCSYCRKHGQQIIDEYLEKLGEVWRLAPTLNRDGSLAEGGA